MKTSLFAKLCSIWATPPQYRGEIRETRTNPALYVTSYEEVQDLTLNLTNKGLVHWMLACAAVYAPNGQPHKTSRQSLIFYLAKKEAAKVRSTDVQKFIPSATKKAESFIKHWHNCQMRGLSVSHRIIHFQPQASPAQEAIKALYHGKLQEVAEFLTCYIESKSSGEEDPAVQWAKAMGEELPTLVNYIETEALESSVGEDGEENVDYDDDGEVKENHRGIETQATMTVLEPRDKASILLEQGLPFKETLEFLEQIEYAEMHKLPEYIGVSRFNEMERNPEPIIENRKKALFPKNTVANPWPWNGADTGGKQSLPDGQVIDADGLFVKPDLWENEITEGNDLAHSPSQERAEEKDIQRYFRWLEDKRTERMYQRLEQLHAVKTAPKPTMNQHALFRQMCQKAREQAMKSGVSVQVACS